MDNPMVINTDYYPYNSHREYRQALEHQISTIDENIDVLNNEIENAGDQIKDLQDKRQGLEEELSKLR